MIIKQTLDTGIIGITFVLFLRNLQCDFCQISKLCIRDQGGNVNKVLQM